MRTIAHNCTLKFDEHPNMREYKISKGWAIFMYIAGPLLIALFCYLLVMPFIPAGTDGMNKNIAWLFVPMSLSMIAVMVIALIDTNKARFIIEKNKITAVSVLSTKELMFDEIKGYRIVDQQIFIEPNTPHKKKIKISKYFAGTNEISEWLSENYNDLDQTQMIEETEDILHNDTFGFTKEQREEKLATARKVSKVLNWTGGLIAAWGFFYPKPYEYAIIAAVVFPVICLAAFRYSKGLIKFDERKGSAYPNIFWAIFAPSMALALRAILDYNVFDHSNVWTPAIIITAVFMAVIITGNKELNFKSAKDGVTTAIFSVFMFAYSYGAVVTLNCIYDKSAPETFNATIVSKRISSGKTTMYYLQLTPWGQQKEGDEVSVSKSFYNSVDDNDKVNIYLKKGNFDIPWFQVTK